MYLRSWITSMQIRPSSRCYLLGAKYNFTGKTLKITFAESGKKRYFYFATTYLACYTFVPNNSRIMYYHKPSQSRLSKKLRVIIKN